LLSISERVSLVPHEQVRKELSEPSERQHRTAAQHHPEAGHAGPAYGVPHEATIEAIRLAGRLEALPLDPVYSGKGLAGLIALIRQGRWRNDEDVVFLHTGGTPALFAYQSTLGI